jgi:hypothetical protein
MGKEGSGPSPLDYYAEKMIMFKRKMPVATIGDSKRSPLNYVNYNPGPGAYKSERQQE